MILLLMRELLQTRVQLLKNSGLLTLLRRELKRQLWPLRMLLGTRLRMPLGTHLRMLLGIRLLRILLGMRLLRILLRIYLLLRILLGMHLLLQILLEIYLLLRNVNLVEILSLEVSLKTVYCQTLTKQLRKITLLLGTKIIRIILYLL